MQLLTSEEQFQEAIASEQPTIIVFKADWCKDCVYINPFMPDVVKQYSDRLRFYQIDVDQLPDLCSELNILGIPSFATFKNGKELIRFVNKQRKFREEIELFLDRSIAVADAIQ